MIPRRLRLHNFLSYRDCEIDLSGVHLAVLSGRNGDGKSALLDGMTWALWGKGRGRLEDDRIRLGAGELLVEFEFEVDRDRFQVVRKRTRGRASGALDFYQVDEDGARRPITGGTATETQSEITRRLRMDYDTFLNSAFIAQGRANEFTRKQPGDRKEVFGKILGLERYERLAEAANDRRKSALTELKASEARTLEAQAEVEGIPRCEEALSSAKAEIAALGSTIAAKEDEAAQLRAIEQSYRRLESALAAAVARQRKACVRHELATSRLDNVRRRLQDAEAVMARGDDIRAGYASLQDLRRTEHAMAELQAEARSLERERDEALSRVAAERARLESQLESARREHEACERISAGLVALEEQAGTLDAERREIEALRARVKEAAGAENTLRNDAAGLAATADSLRGQAAEIKEKEAQLQGAAVCPVCRKPLEPGEAGHVQEEYAAQRKALGEQWKAANAAAAEALREADALRKNAAAAERDAERREQALRPAEKSLHGELAAAQEAAARLPDLAATVTGLATLLESGTFAAPEREAAANADAALARTGYDASVHAAVRADIQGSLAVEPEYLALGNAETEAGVLGEQLAECEAELKTAADEVAECEGEVQRAREELAGALDTSGRLGEVETALAALKDSSAELTRSVGALENRLEHLKATQARIEEAVEREQALKDEIGTFDELGKAFGKNGVQAMLIDQSLPRVEQLANDMLVRMTGGRIQVQLVTQRQNAKGGAVETLDILISDEMGTRGYEMYSGGEAFRVDFALRIALARLLAERSGASLPTLIIDEGFGTQDAEGVDRLVETLNVVKDDFRLILVVTHLEELKEKFERRIEVTKDLERGSYARVV